MDPAFENLQLNQLASSVASLSSGKYSDFSIRCNDGSIIHAHRAVICPRSRVLAAAVDGKFQEAISHQIYLEEDEPSIVRKMIDFFYKLDYDDHSTIATAPIVDSSFEPEPSSGTTFDFQSNARAILGDPPPTETQDPPPADNRDQLYDKHQPEKATSHSLLINAKVYIIADKYEIQALKHLANFKYQHVLPETWNSSAFAESALLVYENTMDTDRMLRDTIMKGASKNVRTLLDRGDFVDLLKRQSDLAVEVLRQVVGSYDPPIEEEEVAVDDWGWSAKKKKKKVPGF